MKYISAVAFALLYSAEVSAVQLKEKDIFDAYDNEAKLEAQDTSDTIDPAELTAEINGDQIAKDVKDATAGVAEAA